jgi:glyoxylase-like metal-dependent hydrolase (beta-lactamase superfamily II)/rhodanese-related sulfurtransferase
VILRQLYDHESSTYTYLLGDEASGQAALIDPVAEQLERDPALVRELDLTLALVLDTHVHADHVTAAGALRARTGARTGASQRGAPCVDVPLDGGTRLALGDVRLEVLATPGHTDDSLCYRLGGAVFTGDTLLIRGCGRADFQNGDARALYRSITGTLFALPDDTVVWPGHDYNGRTSSTIGEERRHNPRLAGKSEAEFVAIMDNLGLPPPRKLAVSVLANRACGTVDAGLFDGSRTAADGYRDLDPATLHAFTGPVSCVDVREPHEYTGELGHIAGSRLVPLAIVLDAAHDWPRDEELILVCRSGNRSGRAAQALAAAGFTRVMNLAGGMLAWNAAGLPIER